MLLNDNLPVFVCLLNIGVITIDNGLLDFYANTRTENVLILILKTIL